MHIVIIAAFEVMIKAKRKADMKIAFDNILFFIVWHTKGMKRMIKYNISFSL